MANNATIYTIELSLSAPRATAQRERLSLSRATNRERPTRGARYAESQIIGHADSRYWQSFGNPKYRQWQSLPPLTIGHPYHCQWQPLPPQTIHHPKYQKKSEGNCFPLCPKFFGHIEFQCAPKIWRITASSIRASHVLARHTIRSYP